MPLPQTHITDQTVLAEGAPLHGLPASAKVVLPANSILVLTRDAGD